MISENARTISSLLIAGAIGAGLAIPGLAALLAPHVLTALFFVVVFSLNTHTQSPAQLLRKPDAFTGLFMFWQMAGVPMIVTVLAIMTGCDLTVTAILIAITTSGSVFASPALVQVVGLNRQIAIRGMILSTCMMPVSLIVFGEINGILPPDLSFVDYGIHILKFIVLPLLVSSVFWSVKTRMTPQAAVTTQRGMHWASTIALMIFCAGMMQEIHLHIENHFDDLVFYAALAITMAVIMYALTVAVFYHCGAERAMTAGLLVANRNVALSFALLSSVFPPEVMTFVAVSQFPIFLTPFLMRSYTAARAMLSQDAVRQ
jgi:BASS family bile acid:Na+ symporter